MPRLPGVTATSQSPSAPNPLGKGDGSQGSGTSNATKAPTQNGSGGGDGEPIDPKKANDIVNRFTPPSLAAQPKRQAPLRPLKLTGDRDWVIYVECRADSVILYPSRREIPLKELTSTTNNALLVQIQQMIMRRQATLRPEDPPYRPQVCFLVRPDTLRSFHSAYPALEALPVPKTRRISIPKMTPRLSRPGTEWGRIAMLRRRRRPQREIAFSFDSFLDVVANVVGIILRLILVAWVGSRAYHGQPPPLPPSAALVDEPQDPVVLPATPEPTDPLSAEIEKKRRELAESEAALLAQLREQEKTSQENAKVSVDLDELAKREQAIASRRHEIEKAATDHLQDAKALTLSMAQLSERSKKLKAEIEALQKTPVAKKVLRYRTPVSQPVSQELICECNRGRVTVIDRAGLEDEATRDVRARIDELRNSFEIRGVTGALGAFRLRYVVERRKELLEGTGPGATPLAGRNFQVRMTQGMFEPVTADRGEELEAALKDGSAFRRIIDGLDPQQTAVTFCVYPDSFALYRQLRDFLHDRDIVVAGRPVPEGVTIGVSVYGSQSRGQ